MNHRDSFADSLFQFGIAVTAICYGTLLVLGCIWLWEQLTGWWRWR